MNWDLLWTSADGSGYAWSSFGLCFALMAAEVVRLRRRVRSTPPVAPDAIEPIQDSKKQAAGGDARLAAAKGNNDCESGGARV